MPPAVPDLQIEHATEQDVPRILRLVEGLADYENLSDQVAVTADKLRATLFGRERAAEVLLARVDDEAVGLAVFFQNYSTFLGQPGIYLEDIFVLPEWRKRGCGRALFERVASIAVERGCGRLEWAVLDWNEPAIRFYQSLGARALDEWTVYRLTGDALRRLGEK